MDEHWDGSKSSSHLCSMHRSVAGPILHWTKYQMDINTEGQDQFCHGSKLNDHVCIVEPIVHNQKDQTENAMDHTATLKTTCLRSTMDQSCNSEMCTNTWQQLCDGPRLTHRCAVLDHGTNRSPRTCTELLRGCTFVAAEKAWNDQSRTLIHVP